MRVNGGGAGGGGLKHWNKRPERIQNPGQVLPVISPRKHMEGEGQV